MVHVCIDKVLSGKEPRKYSRTTTEDVSRAADSSRLAVVRDKLWDIGATIRVRFLDGETSVQSKVRSYAEQWMKHANVKIVFVNSGDAEVRIAFDGNDGSWSYLGRDALDIPQTDSTMNYGWLTPESQDAEYSRVVIHEFGHALGAIHEHQNPAGGIPWKKDAVYKYFMGPPNNWTKDQIDHNLFERYSKTITNYTAFDGNSIMLYPIPAEFTTNGVAIGGNNNTLSELDKNFMVRQYPYPKA